MVKIIGTTFPSHWQYGPEEIEIVESTAQQIAIYFPNECNLLINTTWFGPQFNNTEWKNVEQLIASGHTFDNLFLLSVIDPLYLSTNDIDYLQSMLQIKTTYRIGMFADSKYAWNFQSVAGAKHCPDYCVDDIKLIDPEYTFLLYQRKPRRHRVELTQMLLSQELDNKGIITLGTNKNSSYDWSEGLTANLMCIKDLPSNYKHNGRPDDFGGIPNDLVTLGRLDIWQRHFLNIVSETEFNDCAPTFVTEKIWKPIIGMRPFIIHGQRDVYSWLQKNGFKTFNHYWSHIPCQTGHDIHGNVIDVINFLCVKSKNELMCMYLDMLPLLEYNANRFFEFAQEQQYKINHIFE